MLHPSVSLGGTKHGCKHAWNKHLSGSCNVWYPLSNAFSLQVRVHGMIPTLVTASLLAGSLLDFCFYIGQLSILYIIYYQASR